MVDRNVRLREFELALSKPLETAKGTIAARRGVLVGVESDMTAGEDTESYTGVGEANPLPGWTESVTDCRKTLVAQTETTAEQALQAVSELPAARHGVSLALADAAARERGQPLATSLADGGQVADTVPVNATIGIVKPEKAVETAEQALRDGYETIKIKVGAGDLSSDLNRVRAVTSTVPDRVAIRVDANGAWTPSVAQEAVESFAALGVEYVEQPVPAERLSALAALRGRGVGIAVDETLQAHDPADVLEADAADILVIKPMVLGGIDRARETALKASERGIDTVVTTTIDAVVARTAAVHLAASLPSVRACGFATAHMLEDDLVADPVPVEDGRVRVPDGPGSAGDRFQDLV